MKFIEGKTGSIVEGRAFCPTCGRPRTVTRPRIHHLRHLLLSILTMGLWIVAWFSIVYVYGHWRCTECGSVVGAERHHLGGRVTLLVGVLTTSAFIAYGTVIVSVGA